jgi:hypothetical protein
VSAQYTLACGDARDGGARSNLIDCDNNVVFGR